MRRAPNRTSSKRFAFETLSLFLLWPIAAAGSSGTSPSHLRGPKTGRLAGTTLGPVSVAPEVQREGIGQALITTGLARLRETGAAGCIVVGDTNYYSRFGFVKAPRLAPPGGLEDHFMILCFGSPAPNCVINFHDAFLDPRQG